MKNYRFLISISLFLFSACFGSIEKQGSVLSYYNNTVRTVGGSFKLGALPSAWKSQKSKFRALLFSHQQTRSSITVDSWCRGAYNDGSLEMLSQDLMRGIQNLKIISKESVQLSSRDALKTQAKGRVDGNEIFMSSTVLKMNNCVFDFVYVSSPEKQSDYVDFENMVQGFQYINGPKLL